jgi:hypothetical protein
MDAAERDACCTPNCTASTSSQQPLGGHLGWSSPATDRLMHGEFGIKSSTSRAAPCG